MILVIEKEIRFLEERSCEPCCALKHVFVVNQRAGLPWKHTWLLRTQTHTHLDAQRERTCTNTKYFLYYALFHCTLYTFWCCFIKHRQCFLSVSPATGFFYRNFNFHHKNWWTYSAETHGFSESLKILLRLLSFRFGSFMDSALLFCFYLQLLTLFFVL